MAVIDQEPSAIPQDVRPLSNKTSNAVQVHRERGTAVANPLDADPVQFKQSLQARGENYQALVEWLVGHLVWGSDVAQIHARVKPKDCDHGGPYGGCSPNVAPWHWTDPDLTRAGCEKICGLLGLGASFPGLDDFRRAALKGMEMKNLIVECQLYNGNGDILSSGSGACSLDEASGSLNSAIKRATKRAYTDALKRCAGLSGLATELKKRMTIPTPEQAVAQAQRAAPTSSHAGRYSAGVDLTHIPIGKYKGKRWNDPDVPSTYLDWVLKELADKPDLVRAAAAELERRKAKPTQGAAPSSSSTRTQSRPTSAAQAPEEPLPFDDDLPF